MVDHNTLLIVAALIGTFLHWVVQARAGNVTTDPLAYLVKNPWNTVAMFGATVGACGALISSGQLPNLPVSFVFWTGVATGYGIDNYVNKGPPP